MPQPELQAVPQGLKMQPCSLHAGCKISRCDQMGNTPTLELNPQTFQFSHCCLSLPSHKINEVPCCNLHVYSCKWLCKRWDQLTGRDQPLALLICLATATKLAPYPIEGLTAATRRRMRTKIQTHCTTTSKNSWSLGAKGRLLKKPRSGPSV